jgi:hypothetical protein
MDQVTTLTTGWEPDTPLDDSVLLDLVRLTIWEHQPANLEHQKGDETR